MLEDLNCFLVGGAVRDELLNRPVKDRDWVVVGATVAEMEALGFLQVGRDFPVFLHPETKEEYALARTERKRGTGHKGFKVFASPDITLQEDLSRRDLTINSMARGASGELIDPFAGARDIAGKTLRHVSPAFTEDPLRVLRVARFAAQLPGFSVAPETLSLMTEMCKAGELNTLSAERVWGETERALAASEPAAFFRVLETVDGLGGWFPELIGRARNFRPGDSLSRFVDLALEPLQLEELCERLKIPNRYRQLALDVHNTGEYLRRWWTLSAEELARLFESLKARHSPARITLVCEVMQVENTHQLLSLGEQYRQVQVAVDVKPGPEYGRALTAARVALLAKLLG